MMRPELTVREVVVRYGTVTGLDRVSVTVPGGGVLALVGESGSGKSTLLRTLNRTVRIASGTVMIGGVDTATVDVVALRRRVGYVPQAGGLVPHWTVERNVALVPSLTGHPTPREAARIALARCELPPDRFADRYPDQLSGGQRQRAAIARALAAEQELLLLDEAFGALDAITRDALLDSFAELRSTLGTTTVLVTHDLGEAARLADTVAVLREGRIEQCAPMAALRATPATPYVAQLVERATRVARHVVGSA
ncbi:MAG: ATP-binding cassette domain-containing protein [Gemmatimonadaceae bacterium]|nr:ATP-binding cassette domain-containing protein [Gemmatimonadaceae bacterium]